jgi:hypothetical protein
MNRFAVVVAIASAWLIAAVAPARAQQSAGYDMREHSLNAAGHPEAATVMASAGFRITLDALGGLTAMPVTASASFQLNGGFVSGYPPPSEVTNVRFGPDGVSFAWDLDPASGTYQVYRDALSALQGGGTGLCTQQNLASPVTTDPQVPASGGWFYLVTSRNRLGEEGTKGFTSGGAERLNTLPCP